MVFCIAIMCLGVIGNMMVPFVILKTKDMRNSTNIFLTNLSIADLLVLLVCTPTVLVEVNTKPETWVLGPKMCKLVPFIELTVAHASVLTILAISFERYYAICEPLKAGYVCTKARALLICLAAWIVAALFTSPILFVAQYSVGVEYYDGTKVSTCFTSAANNWSSIFFLMTISLFFLLPLIILIILYAIIAKNLISSDNKLKIRLSKPELSLKARKQVVLMLGAVVLSFFVCLLPFRVLTLWIILRSEESVSSMNMEMYYNILYFCRVMWYLNSAINPILYNLMSSKFRKGFRKLCLCCPLLRTNQSSKSRDRTATFNTTTTSSYLTSTLTSSSVYQHQQILHEQRKLSGKMTLSLDDLRLLEVIANQKMKRRLTRQYSSPLVSFPYDRKPSKITLKISHDKTNANNNDTIYPKPKKKFSANRLFFKCNQENHNKSHESNYRKQLSFDDNLLISNNNNSSNKHKIKLQKRYRSVRFSSTITTSSSSAKVTWNGECDGKNSKTKKKSTEDSDSHTLVPLLCNEPIHKL